MQDKCAQAAELLGLHKKARQVQPKEYIVGNKRVDNVRPRKKRHTSVRKPEGYAVVIRLPKNSNKAFKVSNNVFQDAMLKYYGQKRGEEGCNCKEASRKPKHLL